MSLCAKLNSLTSQNVVSELDGMLNFAQVSIDWYGQRVVSVEGYEGTVEINELAKKFLEAKAFQPEKNPSLQEKCDCYNLWGRVKLLYLESDKELKKTWIFKLLIDEKEYKPHCSDCAKDPMAIMREWDSGKTKNSLFEFSPEEFSQLFPAEKAESIKKTSRCASKSTTEVCVATKEMVEAALQKK